MGTQRVRGVTLLWCPHRRDHRGRDRRVLADVNFSLHSEWNTQNGTAMVLGIRRSAVWEETATKEEDSRVAAHEQREVVQAATTTCSEEGAQLHPCVLRAVRGQEPTAKN